MCNPRGFVLLVVGLTLSIGSGTKLQSRLYRKNATDQEFWQRGYGAVFYDISPYMDEVTRAIILDQIEYISSLSCVKWWPVYPWEDHIDYKVTFVQSTFTNLCTFQEEVNQDGQFLIILGNCERRNLVRDDRSKQIDEIRYHISRLMVRSMGYYNEHQRPNRDCYITVPSYFENTVPFLKLPDNEFFSDFPYDYYSITHVSSSLYSGVRSRNPEFSELRKVDGTLSHFDVMKIDFLSCGGPSYCQSEDAGPLLADGWRTKCKKIMEDEQREAAKNSKCKPNIFEKPGPWMETYFHAGNVPRREPVPQGICWHA